MAYTPYIIRISVMAILAIGAVLAAQNDKEGSELSNTQSFKPYPFVHPKVEPLKELTEDQKIGLPPEHHPDRAQAEHQLKRDIPYFQALDDMGE